MPPLIDDDNEQVPQLIPIPIEQPVNAVEEVINNLDAHENQPAQQQHEEQVLAMDDLTDASDVEPEPAPMPVEPVVVGPFPNLQNLEPLMPEEVDPNDLLGYFHEPENEPGQLQHNDIQVGYVQLFQP